MHWYSKTNFTGIKFAMPFFGKVIKPLNQKKKKKKNETKTVLKAKQNMIVTYTCNINVTESVCLCLEGFQFPVLLYLSVDSQRGFPPTLTTAYIFTTHTQSCIIKDENGYMTRLMNSYT